MVVITGNGPFGKCDNVPELFYVATWCFHLDYFPLIPQGTRLILGKSGKNYHVVHIPFSFKSLLLAWVRAFSFLGSLIGWIVTLVTFSDRQAAREMGSMTPLVIAIVCTLTLVLAMIPKYRKPSYKRACQLAQLAGLSDIGWAALNVQYGHDPASRPENVETLTAR